MGVKFSMIAELEELRKRIDKIEKQKTDEVFTLIEILSNAAFFGKIKQAGCENAKDGQCSFYILSSEAQGKIPIVSTCHIKRCEESSLHFHIELSHITCAMCEKSNRSTTSQYGAQIKAKKYQEKNKAQKNSKKENQMRK